MWKRQKWFWLNFVGAHDKKELKIRLPCTFPLRKRSFRRQCCSSEDFELSSIMYRQLLFLSALQNTSGSPVCSLIHIPHRLKVEFFRFVVDGICVMLYLWCMAPSCMFDLGMTDCWSCCTARIWSPNLSVDNPASESVIEWEIRFMWQF